jgi:hypothetical protein
MAGGQTSSGPGEPAIAAAVRGLARSWRLAWVAAEVLFALILVQFPLFGVLGYELALAATLVGSIAALDLGVALARRAARVPAPALARARDPARLVAALAVRAAGLAVLVTAIPAPFAAVHGLWAPTCDWGFGVRAYLTMVSTGAVIFAGLGVAIGLATAGTRAWVPLVVSLAVVLAIAAAGIWRFYSEPPVFSYSPLLGYFPGNLYDENIRLGAPLLWARLEQVAWVVAALAAVAIVVDAPTLRPRLVERRPATRRGWSKLVLAGALAVALALHLGAGALGYAIDAEDIQAELGGVHETEHFVIHYDARDDELAAEIALIGADHELRLAQVASRLGYTEEDLARLGRIRSYYFRDADQKARLMGARGVEMAKPWRREIYVTDRGFPVPALRHEIAHAVAGDFGDPLFGVASQRVLGVPLLVNPGLVEGLAVAIDWPGSYDRPLTPHQAVRAMQEMGVQPDVSKVLSLGFLSLSSSRSYLTAGSFLKFLLDRDGPRALRRLYASGGDFEAAYGQSLDELEVEWRAMIAQVELSAAEVEMVREQFRHGGLFSRPCPHAVAAQRERADRASMRGEHARAVRLYRDVCADSGGEPAYRLDLADELLRGDDAELGEALAIYHDVAGDPELTSTRRAAALERLAHLAAREADWAGTEARLAEAAALPLADDQARQIEAKLYALRHPGPAAEALRDYFFAVSMTDREAEPPLEAAERVTMLEPGLGLGWYLRGFQRFAKKDHAGAVVDLQLALGLPLPSPRFVRKAARLLAVAGWRTGDHAAVSRAADVLADPAQPLIDQLLAQDWRERLSLTSPR